MHARHRSILFLTSIVASLPSSAFSTPAAIRVDPTQVLRTMDRGKLIGTNIAVWNSQNVLENKELLDWFDQWRPGIVRMPGGSTSDRLYWNGHGVRQGDQIDASKLKDGFWEIDYSAYAPLFMLNPDRSIQTPWFGNVDIKTLHEFICGLPHAQTLVTVNAGTGRARDAAEWVQWANKKQEYGVEYWEIGNELEGHWEAGHTLPDGRELTAEMYAQRFAKFSKAMKKADMNIKIGGAAGGSSKGGFAEAMLKISGKHVDFVSFHTYPTADNREDEPKMFSRIVELGAEIQRIREWIRRYQPQRASQIEIGITEWNCKLHADRYTSDLFSALWSCLWIGEMMKTGVDFATQWDAFTQGKDREGGHALILPDPLTRKSQYWAMWLWRNHMADTLVHATVEGADQLSVVATKSADLLFVMVVNRSRTESVKARIDPINLKLPETIEIIRLTHGEYFWNNLTKRADWNSGPQALPMQPGKTQSLTFPPFSITVVRIPLHDKAGPEFVLRKPDKSVHIERELRILIPKSASADTPVEGWVRAYVKGTDKPYSSPYVSPGNAALTVVGAGTLDRAEVRLNEAAGRFFLTPSAPGKVKVLAKAKGTAASATIEFKPIKERPFVVWDFEVETLGEGYASHWPLATDQNVKSNRRVVRIDLPGVVPSEKTREILKISDFPPKEELDRTRIGGVVFDLLVPETFKCADPQGGIDIIMQSHGNYWMMLGKINFSEAKGTWKTFTVRAENPDHRKVMGEAFSLWFVLSTNQPAKGPLYLDRIGFLLR